MREFRRKIERPGPRLVRGADGRLRQAGTTNEIADIWAEQRRIRLAEAIERDKIKTQKRQRRKERLAQLFKKKRPPVSAKGATTPAPKEFVINIGLPKITLPKLRSLKLSKVKKKRLIIVGVLILVAVAGIATYKVVGKGDDAATSRGSATVNGPSQAPQYQTILPSGKNIRELGGWKRVSPPDKDPVFAYVDTIDDVQISVSEQPLPERFKTNTDGELAKLAEQFTANQKLTVGDDTAYIGTSIKGPQSVLLAKKNLLILIKSSGKVDNDKWQTYMQSLR